MAEEEKKSTGPSEVEGGEKKSLPALRATKQICSCGHQMITKTILFGDKVVKRRYICNNPDCEKSVHSALVKIKRWQERIARALNGRTKKG